MSEGFGMLDITTVQHVQPVVAKYGMFVSALVVA